MKYSNTKTLDKLKSYQNKGQYLFPNVNYIKISKILHRLR